MKQIFLIVLLATSIAASAQNITGTWAGYLKQDSRYTKNIRRDFPFDEDSVFVHLELSQDNRKVTGVFYYAPSAFKEKPYAAYKVSALLDKKNPLAFFKLMKDAVMEDHTQAQVAVYFFRMMEASYIKSGKDEVLYGNWYDEHSGKWVYWVKKANDGIGPRLQEVIDKNSNK